MGAVQDLVRRARELTESRDAPGKLRLSTILTATLGVGGAIAAYFAGRALENGLLLTLAMPIAGIAGLAGLIMLASEALSVSPRDRPDALRAVKAYLGALRLARWRAAHACLSAAAKGAAVVPRVRSLHMEPEKFSFEGWKGFRDYWRYVAFRGKETRHARTGGWDVGAVTEVEPGVALVEARLTISLPKYSLDIGDGASKLGSIVETLIYRVPVYERDGLWYILDGGVTTDRSYRP